MNTTTKEAPIPVRLDAAEATALASLAQATGLTKSEILRRACRLSFPKFLSGEVDMVHMPLPAPEGAK